MHEETVFTCRTNFGGARTANHNVLNEENESRLQHRCAVVVQIFSLIEVKATPYEKKKAEQETMKSFQKHVPPDQKPGIHTDNSLAFIRACEDS